MKVIILTTAVSMYSSWLLYSNPVGGLLLFPPVYIVLKKYMAKRSYAIWKKEMLNQFEEMLRCLAASLQAGYCVENAFTDITRQLRVMYSNDAPVIKELNIICHGLKMNISIEKLLYSMAQRTGISEIMEYAEIINVAKHSGGNLIEITKHNADILHQRRQVISEIETMTTAKKYESLVMNIMPIGILIYLRVTSRVYISTLYSNIIGNIFMTLIFVLYIFAALLGNYITDFDKAGKSCKTRKKKRLQKKQRYSWIIKKLEKTILKNNKKSIDEDIKSLCVNSDKESIVEEFWQNMITLTILSITSALLIVGVGLAGDIENIALYMVIALTVIIAVPYWKYHQIKEKCEERYSQMLLDYPDRLDRLSLLLGAGLSVKGAFKRIAGEYRTKLESGKTGMRYAYEEIVYMVRQLENGMPETVVYEEWGRRSKMIVYMKLSSGITQNLRKGNRDMLDRFRMMSLDALEERNIAMKKLGEKASSKLLLPMMMQFIIILAIIMYPAISNL